MLYLLAIAEMRKQQESVVREIRMLRLMRGAKGLAPTLLFSVVKKMERSVE